MEYSISNDSDNFEMEACYHVNIWIFLFLVYKKKKIKWVVLFF